MEARKIQQITERETPKITVLFLDRRMRGTTPEIVLFLSRTYLKKKKIKRENDKFEIKVYNFEKRIFRVNFVHFTIARMNN